MNRQRGQQTYFFLNLTFDFHVAYAIRHVDLFITVHAHSLVSFSTHVDAISKSLSRKISIHVVSNVMPVTAYTI